MGVHSDVSGEGRTQFSSFSFIYLLAKTFLIMNDT
jgi:hypothetical protein